MRQKKLVFLMALIFAPVVQAQEQTLSTVTVTAKQDDLSERKESITQKIIITKQDIENMGALTISDVMGKLPGIDAGQPGADGSMAMRSRGMARDSVQIFIDGERVAGNARMAQAMIGRMPSTELEKVEIVRGASAEFGGSAPVSVNLVLKRSVSKQATNLKAATGLRNKAANQQFTVSRAGSEGKFSWMVPLTMNFHGMPSESETDRYASAGTRQSDHNVSKTNIKEFVFSPRLSWKNGSDSLTIAPSVFRASGRNAGEVSRTDYVTPVNGLLRNDLEYNETMFNRLRVDGETLRNGTKYTGRMNFSEGGRTSSVTRDSLTNGGTSSLATQQTQRRERDFGWGARADWGQGLHAFATGLEYSAHARSDELNVNNQPVNAEQNDASDKNWSLWLQDEWNVASNVTVTPGLRGELLTYETGGNSNTARQLLPSVAMRWQLDSQWIFRSSLGAGLKVPRLDELSNQPVLSINTNSPIESDRRGNPNLRPERNVNFEAALDYHLPEEMGVLGTNLYLRRTEDFIERRIGLEGARWVDRPYNEGQAMHWGLELDAKVRADKMGWRGATFRSHLTIPRSRVQDDRLGISRQARETPLYQLTGGYDQTMGMMSFGVSFQHFGQVKTEVPGEQEARTENRTVIDMYALQKLTNTLNLRFSVQNLTKERTRNQTHFYNSGNEWSQAGLNQGVRTVMLALEGKW